MATDSNWTDVADLTPAMAHAAEDEGHGFVLGRPGNEKRLWCVNIEVSTTVTTNIDVLVLADSEDEARSMARKEKYTVDPEAVDYLLDDYTQWDAQDISLIDAVEVGEEDTHDAR